MVCIPSSNMGVTPARAQQMWRQDPTGMENVMSTLVERAMAASNATLDTVPGSNILSKWEKMYRQPLYEAARQIAGEEFGQKILSVVEGVRDFRGPLRTKPLGGEGSDTYSLDELRQVLGRFKLDEKIPGGKPSPNDELNHISDTSGNRRTAHLYLEGKLPDIEFRKLSKEAQKSLRSLRELVFRTGEWMEEVGANITLENGKSIPFKVDLERYRMPRTLSPEIRSELAHVTDTGGESVIVDALAKKLAEMNDFAPDSIGAESVTGKRDKTAHARALLLKMYQIETGGGDRKSGKYATENARVFENFPDYIDVKNTSGKPRRVYIIPQKLTGFIDATVDMAAHRASFIRQFGSASEATKYVSDLKYAQKDEPAVIAALQAASAVRTDSFETSLGLEGRPGTMGKSFRDIVFALDSLLRGMRLTRAGVPNLFEPLGNTQSFGGLSNFLAAFPMSLGRKAREKLYQDLAEIDAVNQQVTNAAGSSNEQGAVKTNVEIVRQAMSKVTGFRWANRFVDLHAGATAIQLAKQINRGEGANKEAVLKTQFNFTDAEYGQIVELGKAGKFTSDQRLYRELIRRMVSRSANASSLAAERSWFGTSRAFNLLSPFHSYAQNKMETTIRSIAAVRKKEKGAIPHLLANFGGTIASGAIAQTANAFLGGGTQAVEQLWDELVGFDDDAIKSLVTFAFLGGAYGTLYNSMVGRTYGEDAGVYLLKSMISPVGLVMEGYDAIFDSGKYEGFPLMERMGKLIETNMPVSREMQLGFSMIGLSDYSVEMESANKGYYQVLQDIAPKEIPPQREGEEQFRKDFRYAAREIITMLKDGVKLTDPRIRQGLIEALDIRDGEEFARYVRSRRYFSSQRWNELTEVQRAEMLDRLTDENKRSLLAYDTMLSTLADYSETLGGGRQEFLEILGPGKVEEQAGSLLESLQVAPEGERAKVASRPVSAAVDQLEKLPVADRRQQARRIANAYASYAPVMSGQFLTEREAARLVGATYQEKSDYLYRKMLRLVGNRTKKN